MTYFEYNLISQLILNITQCDNTGICKNIRAFIVEIKTGSIMMIQKCCHLSRCQPNNELGPKDVAHSIWRRRHYRDVCTRRPTALHPASHSLSVGSRPGWALLTAPSMLRRLHFSKDSKSPWTPLQQEKLAAAEGHLARRDSLEGSGPRQLWCECLCEVGP